MCDRIMYEQDDMCIECGVCIARWMSSKNFMKSVIYWWMKETGIDMFVAG